MALVAMGCTTANPNFVASDGGVRDLAVGAADLAPSGCSGDERSCLGLTASAFCENGAFTPDRTCPSGSSCAQTYCAPPTEQLPTQVGQRCDASGGAQQLQCSASPTAMLVCQPFVDPSSHKLAFYCDAPVGAGGAGVSCTQGSTCKSGFCGANGTCFSACQTDFECPATSTVLTFKCTTVDLTVEGVRQSQKSCVPN
jgi:hypothetical protein